MAEEIIKLPTTPDTDNSNTDTISKNSRGNSNTDTKSKNSRGNSNSSNNGKEKVLSRYLKPYSGSCHDHCKYGHSHTFEKDVKRPIRKKFTPPPLPTSRKFVDILILEDKKKKTITPLSDTKLSMGGSGKIIKRDFSSRSSNNLEVSLNEAALNVKETNSSQNLASSSKPKSTTTKPVISRDSSAGPSRSKVGNLKKDTESKLVENRSNSTKQKNVINLSGGSSEGRGNEIKIGKKVGTFKVAVKKILSNPNASLPNKTSVSRDSSLNAKNIKSTKKVSPPLNHLKKITESRRDETLKNNLVSVEKSSLDEIYTLESVENSISGEIKNLVAVRKSSSGEEKDGLSVEITNVDQNESMNSVEMVNPNLNKTTESAKVSSFDSEKTSESTKISSFDPDETSESAKIVSPSQVKVEEEFPKIRISTVESTPSSLSLSPESSSSPKSPSLSASSKEEEEEYTDTETEGDGSISTDNENTENEKIENLKGEYKRKSKRVLLEDENGNPVKLHFRPGKVVDLQTENEGPRRLRFRRGTVLGENEEIKRVSRRKSFKKRGDFNGDGNNLDSEKVTLRHQDVQDKKDTQGLFNNVIEEHASKLVETRSKVKALVGAFETVISLQDNNIVS